MGEVRLAEGGLHVVSGDRNAEGPEAGVEQRVEVTSRLTLQGLPALPLAPSARDPARSAGGSSRSDRPRPAGPVPLRGGVRGGPGKVQACRTGPGDASSSADPGRGARGHGVAGTRAASGQPSGGRCAGCASARSGAGGSGLLRLAPGWRTTIIAADEGAQLTAGEAAHGLSLDGGECRPDRRGSRSCSGLARLGLRAAGGPPAD